MICKICRRNFIRSWPGQKKCFPCNLLALKNVSQGKLTKGMKENLDAICFGCDQSELDKRSVNALIRRGLVYLTDQGRYRETEKGDYVSRVMW